jgi:hypothetical protein
LPLRKGMIVPRKPVSEERIRFNEAAALPLRKGSLSATILAVDFLASMKPQHCRCGKVRRLLQDRQAGDLASMKPQHCRCGKGPLRKRLMPGEKQPTARAQSDDVVLERRGAHALPSQCQTTY